MKILVCISNVPDTTAKVSFNDNNTKFNSAGVQFIINPYDEVALTKALEIAEQNAGSTVTVINVGLSDSEPSIRKALAIGANDAVRINAEPIDAFFVAEQIAKYAKDNGFDLIFTGRESIDYNGGLVGNIVAEMLEMPSINLITSIQIDSNNATMERDIDGGKEKLSCALPLVVSAQQELAEPRIPNMRGIMAARTKPLTVIEPSTINASTPTINFELPKPKAGVKLIPAEQAEQLIDLLHNEARVI